MTRKISLLLVPLFAVFAANGQSPQTERRLWISYMDKVARPVIANLAEDKLKERMPVTLSDRVDNKESRTTAAYLEAFGRTLSGIAPWLNLQGGDVAEVKLRDQYRKWALKALDNATNPAAKDHLQWTGGQELVDASFVALGLIRCPWLWEHLDRRVKTQVVESLKMTRGTVPAYSNWVLFTGMIEAFLCKYDQGDDPVRTEYGVREFTEHWYVGDGLYADGMSFHMDYYNSIVIQPYLGLILKIQGEKNHKYQREAERAHIIAQRYAEILERQINTDGSYPVVGRSIAYRAGVFHHLADMVYAKQLPETLPPAQVREALTAVIKKTLEAPTTFTNDGWLNIGLYGRQPGLAESYITTGSLYLCSNVFLPLGLPDTDPFWTNPPLPWSSVKIWNGTDVKADHALDIKY